MGVINWRELEASNFDSTSMSLFLLGSSFTAEELSDTMSSFRQHVYEEATKNTLEFVFRRQKIGRKRLAYKLEQEAREAVQWVSDEINREEPKEGYIPVPVKQVETTLRKRARVK